MTSRLRYVGPSLLGLAGLSLALSWQRIPERWATHWGPHGNVNGVAHKSVAAVFLPLLLGLMIWTLFECIATVIERSGRVPELARATALPLHLLAIGMAAVFSVLAIALPLWRPARPGMLVGVVLLLAFAPLTAGLVLCARTVSRFKRAGHPEVEGWSGIVYRNPNDDRLLVPHLTGLGYTLNFAKPAAWWLLVLLLLPALAMAVLLVAQR